VLYSPRVMDTQMDTCSDPAGPWNTDRSVSSRST
jgi:hypothetical protein